MSARYGFVIDLDRCTGCGACMVACAAENNVPPAPPRATPRTGLTPMLVRKVSNGMEGAARREAFIPIACMHCGNETPCVSVCPQQAVEVDKATGIVVQMPQRCLGCRYCMTACPYHARYFNWWDPAWPVGMEKSLNPGVAVRMRGVVEKCNMCPARLHSAQEKAAAAGKKEIISRRLHPRLRGSVSHRGHLVRESGRRKRSRLYRGAFSRRVSAVGAARHGTQGLLQIRAGLGESVGGARFGSRHGDGGPAWLICFL